MPPKKGTVTYFSLRKDIFAGKFHPIYVLQGEEPYYIDQLSELIVDKALSADERDFNLTVRYGMDVDVRAVIADCKRYPVMAQRQVVVVREAQMLGKSNNKQNASELNMLKFYAEKPLESTILVVCYKGGAIKSGDLLKAMEKHGTGVAFTSSKPRDYELPSVVTDYCSSNNLNIDNKSAEILSSFIGSDLSRLFGEIDKLGLLVDASHRITPELIEKNIGISKDYNNFELQDAMATRNAAKAFTIVDYFERNPKNNPVAVTVGMLFSFFLGTLLVNTARDTSDAALMARVGARSPWALKKYKNAARYYNTRACVNAIASIRECDVKSKGNGSRMDAYALLKELIYKLIHA